MIEYMAEINLWGGYIGDDGATVQGTVHVERAVHHLWANAIVELKFQVQTWLDGQNLGQYGVWKEDISNPGIIYTPGWTIENREGPYRFRLQQYSAQFYRTAALPVDTAEEDEVAALAAQGQDPQYVRLLESVANAYAEVESLTTINPIPHARAQATARQALDELRQWVSAHRAVK
ncbi:MAG: hypothetical protein ACYC5Y_12480 [Symbiobacteriia bacterium]